MIKMPLFLLETSLCNCLFSQNPPGKKLTNNLEIYETGRCKIGKEEVISISLFFPTPETLFLKATVYLPLRVTYRLHNCKWSRCSLKTIFVLISYSLAPGFLMVITEQIIGKGCWQTYSVKGQIANILGFEGHNWSLSHTLLCFVFNLSDTQKAFLPCGLFKRRPQVGFGPHMSLAIVCGSLFWTVIASWPSPWRPSWLQETSLRA